MRGKIAFVIGLAVGYVLGTRAGRERYEQIKRGAQKIWDSPGVKRGRDQVGGYVTDARVSLQDSVIDAGREFVKTVMEFAKTRSQEPAADTAPAAQAPSTEPAPKTAAKKPAAKKTTAKKPATATPAAKA